MVLGYMGWSWGEQTFVLTCSMPSSDQSCVATSDSEGHWPWGQGCPMESSHQHMGNLPQEKGEAQADHFWDSTCSFSPEKNCLCVFLPLGHSWPQPKEQSTALPFPSLSLSSWCPRHEALGPARLM